MDKIICAKRGPSTMRFDGDKGDEPYQHTSISWETRDGFVYHISYKGPIKEAIKIVDSLKYVK